jgi:hypothetical protein
MIRTWKRRSRLQRVHQPQQARAVREFGAADAVIDVDVLVKDAPAFARGVRPRVLGLTRDRALLVADAGLVSALASVDSGGHR